MAKITMKKRRQDKMFTGAKKMLRLETEINLVICQKTNIDDWVHFFKDHCSDYIYDLADKKDFSEFMLDALTLDNPHEHESIGIIDYELAFHRLELKQLQDFTLLLDESTMIQNETAKWFELILNLNPKNMILLSSTSAGGEYVVKGYKNVERLKAKMRQIWNLEI